MNSRRLLATICGGVLALAACTSGAVPLGGASTNGSGAIGSTTTLIESTTTVASAPDRAVIGGTTTLIESTTTVASAPDRAATGSTTTLIESTTTVASAPEQAAIGSTTTLQEESASADVPDPVSEDPESLNASFVPLDLPVGTCFDDPMDDVEMVGPDDIPIVDCASPHANEVFGSSDVDGEEFPGDASIRIQADDLCYDSFEAYVGAEYESSVYEFSWYFPTAESWPMGGTKIICFAYNVDLTDITGSVENTGR